MIFVAAWMFLLGVIVGRGTAPVTFDIEKFQKELADLKEAVLKKQKQKFPLNSGTPKETELGFYEKLKHSNEENRGHEKQVPVPTPKPKKSIPEKSATRPGPTEQAPSAVSNVYALQVASLKDPKIADKMVDQLRNKGYSAYRTTGIVPDKGTWYRVRIGGFKNTTEAQAALKKLKKEGLEAIMIRQ